MTKYIKLSRVQRTTQVSMQLYVCFAAKETKKQSYSTSTYFHLYLYVFNESSQKGPLIGIFAYKDVY